MSRLNTVIQAVLEELAEEHRVSDEEGLSTGYMAGLSTGYMADRVEAAIVQASGGPTHVLHIADGEWFLRHPIDERFEGDLFGCPINAKVQDSIEAWTWIDWRDESADIYVWLEEDGILSGQYVDDEDPAVPR